MLLHGPTLSPPPPSSSDATGDSVDTTHILSTFGGFREHLTTATTPQPTPDLEMQESYKQRRMIVDTGSSSNSSDNFNGLENEHHKDKMKRLNSDIHNSFALHFHPLTTTAMAENK